MSSRQISDSIDASNADDDLSGNDGRAARTAALLAAAAQCTGSSRGQILDRVIVLNLPVARSIASRYRGRGEPLDDLEQAAYMGLVKAVHGFRPDRAHDFLSYAVPTIRGEVRRHFRDLSWAVRPPRRIQELQPRVLAAADRLSGRLERSATTAEVAAELDVELDEVVEALACEGCFNATSLDIPLGSGEQADGGLADVIGGEDDNYALVETLADLQPALQRLSERDAHVLVRRVRDGWSQQRVAEELNISQMQVSRLLHRIQNGLRTVLEPEVA